MRYLPLLLVLSLIQPVAFADEATLAPDWTLADVGGRDVTLSETVREQPVTVLFFWATWCPYCKALMPHLQSLRYEHGEAVRVLALNIREDGDPAALLDRLGYDFTLLPDADPVAERYAIRFTPGVVIVDGDRRIAFDLRDLPSPEVEVENASHGLKAAHRAPYWAAAIRTAIDDRLVAASVR